MEILRENLNKSKSNGSIRFLMAFFAITLLFIIGIAALQGCKKVCPLGKEGENCEEISINKFLGVWQGTNSCNGGNNQLNISLNGPVDSFKVALTGLISNQIYPIVGSANYTSLVFESNQNLADGIKLTSCSANLNPDGVIKLYFSFTDESVVPAITNTCSFTGKLQSTNSGENFPILTTNSLVLLSDTSVQSGGNISSDGGSPITKRGVVWGPSPSPTTSSPFRTEDGTGVGSFASIVIGLESGKTYYIRAYATNSSGGTAYGNEIKFTKPECLQDGEICIGSFYQNEGIVAYFLKPGDSGYDPSTPHGIIISNNNLTPSNWGCYGSSVGSTSTALGTGFENTNTIISNCDTANIAAKICTNQGSGWYLPSKDELIKIYQNLTANGLGGLSYEIYWSSSEVPNSSTLNAWGYDFSNANAVSLSKYNTAAVRAVKKF